MLSYHRLEKSNFDLKMKVYYLEEKLKTLNTTENDAIGPVHDQNWNGESLATPLCSQQCANLRFEIEQKNSLLWKAKGTIEQLKSELQRIRSAEAQQEDLETRLLQLRDGNIALEEDFNRRHLAYEKQISDLRRQITDKSETCTTLEQNLVSAIPQQIMRRMR